MDCKTQGAPPFSRTVREGGAVLHLHSVSRALFLGGCPQTKATHLAIPATKIISRERAASNGLASQSPKTSRTASPEGAISASICSRDGNRSVLLVVSVLCARR